MLALMGISSLIKQETSLRRIREVITRPHYFWYLTDYDSPEDYTPNPNLICFTVGDGLVIYEPKNNCCVEMFTALQPEDLPKNPIRGLKEQWRELSSMGYNTIYSVVSGDHERAKVMCRSAGMQKTNCGEIEIYTKVLTHG